MTVSGRHSVDRSTSSAAATGFARLTIHQNRLALGQVIPGRQPPPAQQRRDAATVGSTVYVVGSYTGDALARHDRGLPRGAERPDRCTASPSQVLRYACAVKPQPEDAIVRDRPAALMAAYPLPRSVYRFATPAGASCKRIASAAGRHDARRRSGLPGRHRVRHRRPGAVFFGSVSFPQSSRSIPARAAAWLPQQGRLRSRATTLAGISVGTTDPDRRRWDEAMLTRMGSASWSPRQAPPVLRLAGKVSARNVYATDRTTRSPVPHAGRCHLSTSPNSQSGTLPTIIDRHVSRR